MSDFDSLTKVYDALEAHYTGVKVLHPAHLQAYLDAMTRLERRVDALADMYARLLRNATWLDPKDRAKLIQERETRAQQRQH